MRVWAPELWYVSALCRPRWPSCDKAHDISLSVGPPPKAIKRVLGSKAEPQV